MFSTKFVKPRADIDNKGPLKIKPVSIRIPHPITAVLYRLKPQIHFGFAKVETVTCKSDSA